MMAIVFINDLDSYKKWTKDNFDDSEVFSDPEKFPCIAFLSDTFDNDNPQYLYQDDLEQILSKMKELQSGKYKEEIAIEYLQADLSAVTELYNLAVNNNDPFGKAQYKHRMRIIELKMKELQSEVK